MFDETDIPDWEFEAIREVAARWDISGTEAENCLVHEGVLD